MTLQPQSEHSHGWSDKDFDILFTKDKPVIFAFHGYPLLIHRLTYRRTNHDNIHVRGYKGEGTTTTPFEMVVMIVAIGAIASVLRARYGVTRDKHGNEYRVDDGAARIENKMLADEVRMLKERIQVLERLATDDVSGQRLDREIDKLRDRT